MVRGGRGRVVVVWVVVGVVVLVRVGIVEVERSFLRFGGVKDEGEMRDEGWMWIDI